MRLGVYCDRYPGEKEFAKGICRIICRQREQYLRKTTFRPVSIASIILVAISCDQSTKKIARHQLSGRGTVYVLGALLVLKYAENSGTLTTLSNRSLFLRKLLTAILALCLAVIADAQTESEEIRTT